MMAGKVQPDSGVVEVGVTIRMGYFAQEVPDMDRDRRVIDCPGYRRIRADTGYGKITASNVLERFLFTPDSMRRYPAFRRRKKRLYLSI